jgi:hypothetical protein
MGSSGPPSACTAADRSGVPDIVSDGFRLTLDLPADRCLVLDLVEISDL